MADGLRYRVCPAAPPTGVPILSGLLSVLIPALIILPLCCYAATCTAAEPPSAQARGSIPAESRVLILNSYHRGYTWSDNELDGIMASFDKAGLKVDPHVEYLDSKHFADNRHFVRLRDLFAVKYGTTRPTLVMTLDNTAFEFAVTYRRDLFPGIPIVFVGLNDYEPSMLKGESGITGVVERQDIVGTVRAALAIQPKLKEIVIVHDSTASGLASRTEAEQQLAGLSGTVAFRYLPDLTIEEVVTELARLKPDSIVLPFSFSRDRGGRVFTHAQLAQTLAANSPVPVYGTKVERLGHGIIGGSLMEGTSHGAMGAEIALRILRGEPVESIPVLTEPPSELMFDNNLLKRFDIDRDRLPEGSRVINLPPGFYEQHGTIVNIAGGIIAFLGFSLALVITANRRRIHAEKALLQSERKRGRELEIANSEMESFCYAVSHDLQAPLRHISSYSSIFLEEYGDTLDEGGRHYFSRINAASSRMAQLIKDLLMLSQISRETITRSEFDLGKLVEEVREENRIGGEDDRTVVEIGEGMIVHGDRRLLRVVMDNLISNALKYSAKTEGARIRVGMTHEGGKTVYFVRDNGVGFDMQYADKLFAPFHRLHEASEFEGNGIGLATVQRVIHRHGGDVWAESAPGEGATFFFTLGPDR